MMYSGLASDLTRGSYRVLVITSQPTYATGVKRSRWLYQIEKDGKKTIVRVSVPQLNRESLWSRFVVILSYNLLGAAYLLWARDIDVALMTNPAFEVWLITLIVRLKRIPFHYRLHDLYPEIAVRLGLLAKNSLLARAIGWMETYSLNSAGTVSVVTESFKAYLTAANIPQKKVTVIPDWVDTSEICERPKRNDFSERYNLTSKFVVGYGGNVGLSQGLEVLVEAASLLKEETKILFLIVGEGAKKRDLMTLRDNRHLNNLMFLPYQPSEIINDVYGSWDIGFISLTPGVSPEWRTGKIFSIMASTRPVLAAADIGGEVHRVIEKTQCGICIPGGDAILLARAIAQLFADRANLQAFGINGRRAVEEFYSRKVCTKQLESQVTCLIRSHHQ